jgi:hypothetical protein
MYLSFHAVTESRIWSICVSRLVEHAVYMNEDDVFVFPCSNRITNMKYLFLLKAITIMFVWSYRSTGENKHKLHMQLKSLTHTEQHSVRTCRDLCQITPAWMCTLGVKITMSCLLGCHEQMYSSQSQGSSCTALKNYFDQITLVYSLQAMAQGRQTLSPLHSLNVHHFTTRYVITFTMYRNRRSSQQHIKIFHCSIKIKLVNAILVRASQCHDIFSVLVQFLYGLLSNSIL